MRKCDRLPLIAALCGILGFFLRRWQYSSAYLPEEQLFRRGSPVTPVLLVLGAALAVALVFLVRDAGRPGDFLSAFRCPLPLHMAVMAASAFLLMGGGLLTIRDGASALALWRIAGGDFHLPLFQLVQGILSIPAGLALLLMGRAAYRKDLTRPVFALAPLLGFSGLVWLLTVHLTHGIDPEILRFAPGLLAAALLTLAHYFAVSFLFGRYRPRSFAYCALLGAALGITSLADIPSPGDAALTAAFSLSALAEVRALLYNASGAPWPEDLSAGAEEDPGETD